MPTTYELHVSIPDPIRAQKFAAAFRPLIDSYDSPILPSEAEQTIVRFQETLNLDAFTLRTSPAGYGSTFSIDASAGQDMHRIEVDNGHWRYQGTLRKRSELSVMLGQQPGYCKGFEDGVGAVMSMIQDLKERPCR